MPNRSCTYLDPHNMLCCSECGRSLDLCVCVNPDAIAHGRLTSVDGLVIRMVRDELVAAREAFPTDVHRLAALGEEYGELCKALMEHDLGLGTTTQQVLREAVQVAAMAIRVATEGDSNFTYLFPAVEDELPKGPVSDRF
jgi:hypothetical protein